ncbi:MULTISPECIES: hypothetical protein [Aeromonas]|uniref:hypothetical protein n=1 Tax=Aeromonas TaxID=642 RepID=UPI001603CBE9|nr:MULTISPECIES: hypothetical protein [Aeromonas]
MIVPYPSNRLILMQKKASARGRLDSSLLSGHTTTGLPSSGPDKRESKEECWLHGQNPDGNALTIKGFAGLMQVKLAHGR